jgi:hypothetical protein
MSTRSYIARENTDGSFDVIYCHGDSYIEHHGPILLNHYSDPAKVDQLIALGDISSLGPEIGEKLTNWYSGYGAQCRAYMRDRGEEGVAAWHEEKWANVVKEAPGYIYVFRVAEGKWYWQNTYAFQGKPGHQLQVLTPVAIAEATA